MWTLSLHMHVEVIDILAQISDNWEWSLGPNLRPHWELTFQYNHNISKQVNMAWLHAMLLLLWSFMKGIQRSILLDSMLLYFMHACFTYLAITMRNYEIALRKKRRGTYYTHVPQYVF